MFQSVYLETMRSAIIGQFGLVEYPLPNDKHYLLPVGLNCFQVWLR